VLQDILDEAVDLHLGILGLREIQSSKFMLVFNGLLTSNWALGFPKYTRQDFNHTLWFSLFLVVARRSSRQEGISPELHVETGMP